MLDSISASALSPSSLGSTLGAGMLSMASACLLARALKSHPDVGSTPLSVALRRFSQCRSLYHCSLSMTRCSSAFFPVR